MAALTIAGEITLDGRLDETVWGLAETATGFTQREPLQGEPSTERTLVYFVYTEQTLYIGVRALDSDPSAIIATEMQRDGDQSFGGGRFETDDSVAILLDTFHDGRNSFYFETNPYGARADALITDEGRTRNYEWDGVWDAAATRTDEGWSAELAIPFNTLRFNSSSDTWGLNVRRLIRRKTEEVNWAPIMRDADMFRASLFGRLTNMRVDSPERNLRIKPFGTADASEGFDTPVGEVGYKGDVGLDVRWGVTDSLTFDLTINTDFAQVEADEQQVNLTRFSLFFPEKREFFLENAGIFEFGPSADRRGGGFRPPLLKVFHSRRIGIGPDGSTTPILAGAKLTGRVGGWSLGLLNVQSDEVFLPADPDDVDDEDELVPSTNWTVARLKRNLGQRSNVGMIFTNRQANGDDYNRVLGFDADINPSQKLNFNGFFTASDSPGDDSENWAAAVGAAWRGPTWQWSGSATEIRKNYDPEAGFLLRSGIRRFDPQVSFQPRPDIGWIRNFRFQSRNTIFMRTDGTLETYDGNMTYFGFTTQSDEFVSLSINPKLERLFEPFEIFEGVIIPPGDYTFYDWGAFFRTNDSRMVSTFLRFNAGEFFDGNRLQGNITITLRPSGYFTSETEWMYNDVDLPGGSFETNLVRQRFNISFSPNLFLNSFIQYSDADELVTMNIRFNWIYRPGADLFIVYNQNRVNRTLENRALILKFTYLWSL